MEFNVVFESIVSSEARRKKLDKCIRCEISFHSDILTQQQEDTAMRRTFDGRAVLEALREEKSVAEIPGVLRGASQSGEEEKWEKY